MDDRALVRAGRLLTVTGFALVLLAALAPAVRAETISNTTMNVPAEVRENPCAADMVALHGQRHLVLTATSDGAGGYHATISHNATLEGRGLVTGAPYRASEIDETVKHVRPPFPAVVSYVHNVRLIAQGKVSNYLLSFRTRIVVHGSGLATITPDGSDFRCTG